MFRLLNITFKGGYLHKTMYHISSMLLHDIMSEISQSKISDVISYRKFAHEGPFYLHADLCLWTNNKVVEKAKNMMSRSQQ